MIFLRRLRQVLNLLFHGDASRRNSREVQAFYQTMVDRYIERGVPEQEARRLAASIRSSRKREGRGPRLERRRYARLRHA